MSRIGKKIIMIQSGVTATVTAGVLTIKGPKGELSHPINPKVDVHIENNTLYCTLNTAESADDRALWGLHGALARNMVAGVTTGFEKKLEVRGVGYKSRVEGSTLILDIGYSHEVRFPIPKGITITVEKTFVTVSGIDKQLVGQTASQIRAFRKPEPYKGKGIRYTDETVLLKAGKAAKTAAK